MYIYIYIYTSMNIYMYTYSCIISQTEYKCLSFLSIF